MLGQGTQRPTCQFCGASLIFRGQTSCQACGQDLSGRTATGETAPTAPTAPALPNSAFPAVLESAATPESAASPSTPPAEPAAPNSSAAPEPVRLFESSKMPAPTPLPASVRLNDMMAPEATRSPSARVVTPAAGPASHAGAAPPSTMAQHTPDPTGGGPSAAAATTQSPAAPHRTDSSPRPPHHSGSPQPARGAAPMPASHQPPANGARWSPVSPANQSRQARWQPAPSSGSGTNWSVWIGLSIVALALVAIIANAGNQTVSYPDGTFDYANNIVYETATPAGTIAPKPEETFTPAVFPATDPLASVGALQDARTEHTATLLPDGRVVIVGGLANPSVPSSALSSIETYDPKTSSFKVTGSLSIARYEQTATSLGNGKVLIAGGRDRGGHPLFSAELYDSKTGKTVATGSMSTTRASATAVLLDDGRVLIVGGNSAGDPVRAELYNPYSGAGQFTQTPSPLGGPVTAVKLADGRVLIAGGRASLTLVTAVVVFDPTDETYLTAAFMDYPREGATSCLLPDGRVLVVGGFRTNGSVLATADIFDGNPFPDKHLPPMSLADQRARNTTTALRDGSVLMVGGQDDFGAPIATIERYDPVADVSTPIGTMARARMGHTATLLADGSVLIVGGETDQEATLADASLYRSNGAPMTSPAVSPSEILQPSVSPGGSPSIQPSQSANPSASASAS